MSPASMSGEQSLPTAVLAPRRPSLLWVLPMLALLLAAWLGVRAFSPREVEITVQFERGYGLSAGDEVRYRGIAIGEVLSVLLAPERDAIEVRLSLLSEASHFAREGSRFWIVRPQISLAGIRGVETLLGTRYVAALPGSGGGESRQYWFLGLETPRVVDSVGAGDLEIILESKQRGNLDAGTAVTYREIRIGTVIAVGLSLDGRTVEARAQIEKPYVPLIRQGSRFFFSGGVGAHWGSRLLWMEFEGDLARLGLGGSAAVATPPDGGPIVKTGHRFELADEPRQEWLEWNPSIAIGNALLPEGTVLPRPIRARLSWRQGFFKRSRSNSGWLLQTEAGLVGPEDLLMPPEDADSPRLEAEGQALPVGGAVRLVAGLARCEGRLMETSFALPEVAPPAEAVDCLVFGDRPETPLSLPAHRMRTGPGSWIVDRSVGVDPRWHGGAVLDRESGVLCGFLLVEGGEARVVLLPGKPEDG
ncbi:MAG: MlaD family protein [Planctomycetota bacterium]